MPIACCPKRLMASHGFVTVEHAWAQFVELHNLSSDFHVGSRVY